MHGIRNPLSPETSALLRKRPDVLRVVEGLRTTDLQRQVIESWDTHRAADSDLERLRSVTLALNITSSVARLILAEAGLIPMNPGAERTVALKMLKEGKSIDHVRHELAIRHDLVLEMAIADLARELVQEQQLEDTRPGAG